MALIFCAIAIVAVTAAQHAGWWSLLGYALAAVTGITGGALAFGDLS